MVEFIDNNKNVQLGSLYWAVTKCPRCLCLRRPWGTLWLSIDYTLRSVFEVTTKADKITAGQG